MFRLFRPAFAVVAILGLVAAGCGGSSGTPTPSPISDPEEIISRSVEASKDVKSLHVRIAVSGDVDLGSFRELTGGLGGTIDLAGTYVEGDLDSTDKTADGMKADLKFGLPGLLGLKGRIIVVDGYVYTQVSPKDTYGKTKLSDLGDSLPVDVPSAAPSASGALVKQIDELRKSLKEAGATATLKGDEKVDGKDSYHIVIDIPAEKLNDLMGEASEAVADASLESLKIDYFVYKDDLRPAKLSIVAGVKKIGDLTLELVITKYDRPVNIKAPEASEILETPQP